MTTCLKCNKEIKNPSDEDLALMTVLSSLEGKPLHSKNWKKVFMKYADPDGKIEYRKLMSPLDYCHGIHSLQCNICGKVNHVFFEIYVTSKGLEWDVSVCDDPTLLMELHAYIDVTGQRLGQLYAKNLLRYGISTGCIIILLNATAFSND